MLEIKLYKLAVFKLCDGDFYVSVSCKVCKNEKLE